MIGVLAPLRCGKGEIGLCTSVRGRRYTSLIICRESFVLLDDLVQLMNFQVLLQLNEVLCIARVTGSVFAWAREPAYSRRPSVIKLDERLYPSLVSLFVRDEKVFVCFFQFVRWLGGGQP